MSICMKMHIEVDPHHLEDFFEVFERYAVPLNEERSVVLRASFVETLGPIKCVV